MNEPRIVHDGGDIVHIFVGTMVFHVQIAKDNYSAEIIELGEKINGSSRTIILDSCAELLLLKAWRLKW